MKYKKKVQRLKDRWDKQSDSFKRADQVQLNKSNYEQF